MGSCVNQEQEERRDEAKVPQNRIKKIKQLEKREQIQIHERKTGTESEITKNKPEMNNYSSIKTSAACNSRRRVVEAGNIGKKEKLKNYEVRKLLIATQNVQGFVQKRL